MMPRAVLIAAMGILCGCAGSPARSVYVLSKPYAVEAPGGGASATPASGPPVLQLAPVLIPDYLDTSDIQWRVGQHGLQSSTTGRWSERLSTGITNALRFDLAAQLPGEVILLRRADLNADPRILVTIDAFDASPDGRCVLSANWTVTTASGGAAPVQSATLLAAGGSNAASRDESVVTAMSTLLDELAGRIAGSLRAPR